MGEEAAGSGPARTPESAEWKWTGARSQENAKSKGVEPGTVLHPHSLPTPKPSMAPHFPLTSAFRYIALP